jgi:ABC-type polysaccharide/polyol phosphate export permease
MTSTSADTAAGARPAPSQQAPTAPIRRSGVLAEFGEIGRDLWDYRELLFQLARRDIRIRYKQAVMGFGWAVFMPMFVVLAGLLVRFAMAHLSHTTLDAGSVAGLAVKSVPWSFFVGSLGFAVASLVGNSSLVSKIYFPREVLPLSATLAQGFDSLIGSATVTVGIALMGVRPTWALLWLPVLAALVVCFTAATGLFVGCANLFFRDVKYIVQVLLTFGIFFTPVFFEPAMFGPLGARLMMLNPLAPLLEGIRLCVVEGHNLLQPLTVTKSGHEVLAWTPWYLLYGTGWALGGLLGSALLFHRLESRFAEYL